MKHENRDEALGARMVRDQILSALSIGAMDLNGCFIHVLLEKVNKINKSLENVPKDWAMTNAELCAASII